MKWILSHATEDIHHWQLQIGNGIRYLNMNLQRLSLRLTGFSKRLFFLHVHGFLQRKIALRTEYGLVIGETSYSDKPLDGQLQMNGKKFFFRVRQEQLRLLDADKTVIGECEVTTEAMADKLAFFGLLFGFAWFLLGDQMQQSEQAIA